MLDNVGESDSFFTINNEYFFEEIFNVLVGLFELFLLRHHSCEIEIWIAFAMDVSLHIMALISGRVPLKGY